MVAVIEKEHELFIRACQSVSVLFTSRPMTQSAIQNGKANVGGVTLRAWRLGQGGERVPTHGDLRDGRGNMSAEAAGAHVGVTRQCWLDWEKGNRIPRPEFMARLTALVPELDAGDFYIPVASETLSGRTDSAADASATAKAA